MEINLEEFKELIRQKGWSLVDLAQKMNIEYSFLYRVINGQRNPGKRFFSGLMLLCVNEGLDFEKYVLFPKSYGKIDDPEGGP